jgi:hypothetical protein
LTPLALCRLDADLVERVRSGRGLGALIAGAWGWTTLGAALYGCAFGLWRSPVQALYAGLKLPLLLCLLVATTTLGSSVFAKIVGAELDTRQSLACSLVCMSTLATILLATTPASLVFALATERYDEALVGQRGPEVDVAMRDAQLLLAYHTTLIGVAGVLALRRLHSLLRALAGTRATSFFALWLLMQAFAGTQLSWVLRPYLGKPTLPVQIFRDDALRGSFLEEVGRWLGL